MKVLQVLGKSSGGIRQHVAALARELEDRNISSIIAGPTNVMNNLANQKVRFDLPRIRNPKTILNCIKTIRNESRSVDIVHAHGVTIALMAVLSQVFKRKKTPIVLTLHNVIGPNKSGLSRESSIAIENFVFSKVDKVICPSQFSIDKYELKEAWGEKFEVILPLVRSFSPETRKTAHDKRSSTRAQYGIGSDEIVLCCIARLSPQKDLDVLINAFAMVVKSVPNARLVLAGDGSPEYISELKKLVAESSLNDFVSFVGYVNSPALLLAASDLFVLSSSSETVPFVILEALSVGLPVVMTNTGIASQILDGVCGDHVPVGDIHQLAYQIVRWSACVGAGTILRSKLEETANSWLDADSCVQPIIDIYSSLASG